MAKDSTLKAIIDRLLGKPKPVEPEKSAFEQADIEREAERQEINRKIEGRKQAAVKREVHGITFARTAITHPLQEITTGKVTPTRSAFDRTALSSKIKEQQVMQQRFRSDPARAAALEAMELAASLRDAADEKRREAEVWMRDQVRQWGTHRSMSEEGGKAVNERLLQAFDDHDKAVEEIRRNLALALYEAERLNPPPGYGFRKSPPQLLLAAPPRDHVGKFEQAAEKPDWLAAGAPEASPMEEPEAPPTVPDFEPDDWAAIFFYNVQAGDPPFIWAEVAEEIELDQGLEPELETVESEWVRQFNEAGKGKPNPNLDIGPDR